MSSAKYPITFKRSVTLKRWPVLVAATVALSSIGLVAQAAPPPATITLTAPTAGQVVSGVFTFNATTTGKVTRVDYFVDGVAKVFDDSAPTWDEAWDSTTVPDGGHTAKAV